MLEWIDSKHWILAKTAAELVSLGLQTGLPDGLPAISVVIDIQL